MTANQLVEELRRKIPGLAGARCVNGGTMAEAFGALLSKLDVALLDKITIREETAGDQIAASLIAEGLVEGFPFLTTSWKVDFNIRFTETGRARVE